MTIIFDFNSRFATWRSNPITKSNCRPISNYNYGNKQLQQKYVYKTSNQKCCVKTPSEAQLAPFSVIRNFVTIAPKPAINVFTNLAKQPAENVENEEEDDYDEDKDTTVLDFSSGTAQETESTGK